jgi:hypothetical protein
LVLPNFTPWLGKNFLLIDGKNTQKVIFTISYHWLTSVDALSREINEYFK